MSSKMYRSKLNILGRERVISIINHDREFASIATIGQKVVSNAIHHIHIIDRSGSMSGHINGLIENVKMTINHMEEDDFVSLIWFSGSGQFKTLIKGANKQTDLNSLLDSIKSTVGYTCFSESIHEANTIVADLKLVCPRFNITLFTDGCICGTNWSEEEEKKRIFSELKILPEEVLAFNTIGYGNYYDKNLLKEMSSKSQYGVAFHSSNINEYMPIFAHNYSIYKEMNADKIEVSAKDAYILYLSQRTSKLINSELKINSSDKSKNQIVIIGTDDKDFEFSYNGTTYKTRALDEFTRLSNSEQTLTNIYYALISQLYYTNCRDLALDVSVKNLHNSVVADMILLSFTFDEVERTQKQLNDFTYYPQKRTHVHCESDYIPDKNEPCVMELLSMLATLEDVYFIPAKDYARIGLKTEDKCNMFTADKVQPPTPFSDLVFNESKLNASLRYYIKGKVKLLPSDAKSAGLDTEIPSGMFRMQTIVKDGFINMPTLSVAMTDEALQTIHNEFPKIVYKIVDKDGDTIYVDFDLESIPIINARIAEIKTSMIHEQVVRQTICEGKQKILNYLIKQVAEKNENAVSKTLRQFTPEQIEMLEKYGLDKNLNYKGIDVVKKDKADADYYMCRILEFALKGLSSLPKVEEMMEGKVKNEMINSAILFFITELQSKHGINLKSISVKTFDKLNKLLKDVKKELTFIRMGLAASKIGKVLTGGWYEDTIHDGKGNYTHAENEYPTLIIKTGTEKVYF